MMQNQKITVLNVPFDNLTQKELLIQLNQRIQTQKKTFIVTANPEIVMYANQHTSYMETIRKADYITADGIGIVKGAGMLGTPIVERVAGYDLMLNLLKDANKLNQSVYLVGAKEEVILKTVKKIQTEFPNIELKGYHNGYFELTDKAVLNQAVKAQADIIFVGLGFPKQEKWIQHYLQTASKGLAMGVGGSFDAYTGTVKRAPDIFIKMNIEWLYRLIKQPTRFKRMLMIPKFLLAILNEKNQRSRM